MTLSYTTEFVRVRWESYLWSRCCDRGRTEGETDSCKYINCLVPSKGLHWQKRAPVFSEPHWPILLRSWRPEELHPAPMSIAATTLSVTSATRAPSPPLHPLPAVGGSLQFHRVTNTTPGRLHRQNSIVPPSVRTATSSMTRLASEFLPLLACSVSAPCC
jgi:hypothetical protein